MTGIVTTTFDEQFGKKLWDELRESREFRAQGMFWLLEDDWHLVIASPIVDQLGPRDAYRKLAEVARFLPNESGQLLRIELISPRNPLYQAFQTVFSHTPADRVEGRRLTASQVAGMYIQDAYFYGVR
jgi:hypothetical protein